MLYRFYTNINQNKINKGDHIIVSVEGGSVSVKTEYEGAQEMDIDVKNFHKLMTPDEKKHMTILLRSSIGTSVPENEFENSLKESVFSNHTLRAFKALQRR